MELLKNEASDDKKIEKKVIEIEQKAKDSKRPIPVKESKEGSKQFLLQE